MSNSSDEFWDLDGTSLHQYGWSVETLGGTRFGVPPLRGEDRAYAYVPGEAFRPKIPGSRVITLAMWLIGADPATGDPTGDQRLRWNDSWRFLRRLMWTPARQVTLTRRWYLTDPDTDTPGIVVATAEAQFQGGLEPSMTGRTRAGFTVDFKLADPFFYGPVINRQINVGETVTITNPGDYDATHHKFTVDLVGPLTDPVLTNSTTEPTVWVKYAGSIPASQTVTLDIENYTAVAAAEVSIPENTTNRINNISHDGSHQWMGLLAADPYREIGGNTLTLTAASGTGHAIVAFRPPYI